ncbi:tRNA-dependent cyclodipeptide synthase [Mycobacterium tuberculosis]
MTGGTRDDSAPNSRFQLGRRIPEATAQEGFLVRPFTQQCQIIHTEGDHAVIGVSPGEQLLLPPAPTGSRALGSHEF